MTRWLFAGVLALVSSSAHAADQRPLVAVPDAEVTFHAVATGGLKVVGKTNKLSYLEEGDKLRLVLEVAGFDTGIGLRNRHMLKAVEGEKYPTAELVLPRAAAKGGDVEGELTFHGQTKKVPVKIVVGNQGGKVQAMGSLKINIVEFGIEPPGYLGVNVKPDVTIDVKVPVPAAFAN